MAFSSFGTLLQIGDGATPTEGFTTIAEVRDISGPGLELGTEDVTSHSSTWREFVTTVLGGGEVSFDINFTPLGATHRNASGGLLYQMTQKTLRNWRIQWPDGSSTRWVLPGYLVAFEPSAPVEGVLSASVTIRISGAPTLT